MNTRTGIALTIIILVSIVFGCRREQVNNPYDEIDYTISNDNPDFEQISNTNFAYLHAKVFRPTCANAGCHDGTFEPEFRSISSSYNTLVNHAVISNDAQNSFEYRVVPGNVQASLLHKRLTENIPNTSGMMPLEVDPGSDWPQKRTHYIELIEDWITNGAPDMFGNPAPNADSDFPPTIEGLAVFPADNTTDPYERDGSQAGITPILVDNGQVDIWILATDDNTPQENIEVELEIASSLEGFTGDPTTAFNVGSNISALDFFDNPTTFHHKATIDLSDYSTGDHIFLKCYADDLVQSSPAAIPGEGSSQQIISIFILKIQ